MAKARSKKESEIAAFVAHSKEANSAVLVRYLKLNVKDERMLRSQLRAAGCEMQVIKKTLLTRALGDLKLKLSDIGDTTGSFAMIFGKADEVGPAKIVAQFSKKNPAVTIVAGMYAQAIIQKQQVLALASLPSREQLLGQLLNLIQSPVTRLVRSLASPMQGLVTVLQARKDKITS